MSDKIERARIDREREINCNKISQVYIKDQTKQMDNNTTNRVKSWLNRWNGDRRKVNGEGLNNQLKKCFTYKITELRNQRRLMTVTGCIEIYCHINSKRMMMEFE